VQNASPKNTYIWLEVEVILALIRVYIWGRNPTKDEKTGLSIDLTLSETIEKVPTILTAQDYRTHIVGGTCEPFVVLEDNDFLEYISEYTGPFRRFSDPNHHVVIYYTLAGRLPDEFNTPPKILLTIIRDLESRSTFMLVHNCPSTSPDPNNPSPTHLRSEIARTRAAT
jgi:hypothetical protein